MRLKCAIALATGGNFSTFCTPSCKVWEKHGTLSPVNRLTAETMFASLSVVMATMHSMLSASY